MAEQAMGKLSEAVDNYTKGVELDANNVQCKQMLDAAESALMQQTMKVMGGMGGMFGGG